MQDASRSGRGSQFRGPQVLAGALVHRTFKAALVAMLFAIPLGVGAAIYSSEFAPARLREIIKPVIELLAAIPSVVLGFFALIVLASWLQNAFGLTYRLNALNAGLALGITVIPVVYTVAEDAMTAVPRSLRDAATALGPTPGRSRLPWCSGRAAWNRRRGGSRIRARHWRDDDRADGLGQCGHRLR